MKLVWDKVGERFYETGCDHGVLYPIQTGGKYNKGVAWNGLSAVTGESVWSRTFADLLLITSNI